MLQRNVLNVLMNQQKLEIARFACGFSAESFPTNFDGEYIGKQTLFQKIEMKMLR